MAEQKQYLHELEATELFNFAEKLWHAQSLPDLFEEDDGRKGSS